MLRQLLTLLAVISGFTLTAEPVTAAELREMSIAAADEIEACKIVVPGPLQALPYLQTRPPEDERKPCRRVRAPLPPVMVGSDRARE